MATIIGTTCIIFQILVTIYLFNIGSVKDDFEKNMMKLLVVLLMHICLKLLLLVWLHNELVYGKLASAFGLSYGPLLYFTARGLVERPVRRKQSLLHLLPFLAFSIVYFTLLAGWVKGYFSIAVISAYTTYFQWTVVLSLLTYSYIVKSTLHAFKKKKKRPWDMQMTLTDQIAAIFFWGMLAGALLEITPGIKMPYPGFQLRILPYIFFAVVPVLILRYKFKKLSSTSSQPSAQLYALYDAVQENTVELNHAEKRYQKSAISNEMMNGYEKNLLAFMEKSRIFLDAELSLDHLAREIDIPKHHLTQLLNDRIKKNFYHFVNEYRIEEAKRKLDQISGSNETSLLSLAYDCGFNSKSTFNNYFKKITGHTPSSYKKNHSAPPLAV